MKKGYKPTAALFRKMGLNHNTAKDLVEGAAKSIKVATLEEICMMLDCTPNDLLNFVPAKDQVVPDHPLHKLTKPLVDEGPVGLVKQMNADELDRAAQALRSILVERKKFNPKDEPGS